MSDLTPVTPAARWLRAVVIAWPALLPALLFLPMLFVPPVNHDVAAILSFSERWLAGEQLYVDLVDVNPPLIFVLNLVPVAIAQATGLSSVTALLACLAVLGFAIWRLTLAVRDRVAEGPIERALLDVLPGLVIFGAGYDFGQRDTLMAALALPYLLAAARRLAGQDCPARVLPAVAAAIGFALKPHFLAIPALVEAAVLVATVMGGQGARAAWGRALGDPVPWIMAAIWGAYLASLPLVFPAYLDTVVPQVMRYYVTDAAAQPWSVLMLPRLGTAAALLVALAVLAWRQDARLPHVLALAGVGALVSAVVQQKGWSYHIMPIELFACSLATLLAARWLDRRQTGATRQASLRAASWLSVLFALFLVARGETPWNQLSWHRSDAFALTRILRDVAPGARILVLSPGIAPIYPALNYAHAHMTLPAMNVWLLEGAYAACPPGGKRYRDVWEMGPDELFLYRSVAEDIAEEPPDAVVIDAMTAIPECDGTPFSLIRYFARHTLFAQTWSRYAQVAQHGRYTVYLRHE